MLKPPFLFPPRGKGFVPSPLGESLPRLGGARMGVFKIEKKA